GPAVPDAGSHPFRWRVLALARPGGPPALVAGEYARGRRTRRLLRLPLDAATGLPLLGDGGVARPTSVADGALGMQGVVERDGVWHVTTSHGPVAPGSL
ncbi:hypothetical protein, partial [Escherichia coli]|uniref:hypothetical protein n=1 Tax=Escherichia coli TaxID=562 RepID=UPI003F295A6C